jgi:16S rRNA (guanine1207-N2)-methyltransferase
VNQPHYFSSTPSSSDDRREIEVELGGATHVLTTSSGVFSADGLDRGTSVLLNACPEPVEHGHILDIGCGWGAIALDAALRSPEATVWAIDVNDRARALCQENAKRLHLNSVNVLSPENVPEHLRFAQIRSNPPIRVGKDVLHAIIKQWVPRLEPGGSAYFVVAKHLGAPSLERWIAETFAGTHRVNRLARAKGFHIIEVFAEAPAHRA